MHAAVTLVVAFGASAAPAVGPADGADRSDPARSTRLLATAGVAASAGGGFHGHYAWPVRGPVLRPFDEPADAYSAGHRGIDIGAPFGAEMVAAQEGVVAFAGWVAGSLYLSIDHPDGIRTTYSWLSAVAVAEGDAVSRGQRVGWTGTGHPDATTTHLHFGARIGSTYIDPLTLLEPASVAGLIRLAPLEAAAAPDQPAWGEP